MKDRFQVCLGFYWYMAYGYADYREACEIEYRLDNIMFHPAPSDEYTVAMLDPRNVEAKAVFDNLMKNGYQR
jgi:hypothetical protein